MVKKALGRVSVSIVPATLSDRVAWDAGPRGLAYFYTQFLKVSFATPARDFSPSPANTAAAP